MSDPVEKAKSILELVHATAHFQAIENPKQRLFLSAFSLCGMIKTAADQCGVARENHYFWLRGDIAYKKAFESCRDLICSMIEDSLVEKLIYGWEEPVFHAGEQVGVKQKFDLNAQLKYLERVKPDVFGAKIETDLPLEGIDPLEMVKAMRGTVPNVPNSETSDQE